MTTLTRFLTLAFDVYYEIEGFTYCSYNAFAQTDVTVEIAKNGRMKTYGTSRTGQRYASARKARRRSQQSVPAGSRSLRQSSGNKLLSPHCSVRYASHTHHIGYSSIHSFIFG